MNNFSETPAREVETVDLSRDGGGVIRKINEIYANQGCSAPLWLKTRSRLIGFRRHELERTHWKKVWRSMFEN